MEVNPSLDVRAHTPDALFQLFPAVVPAATQLPSLPVHLPAMVGRGLLLPECGFLTQT